MQTENERWLVSGEGLALSEKNSIVACPYYFPACDYVDSVLGDRIGSLVYFSLRVHSRLVKANILNSYYI